MKRAQNQLKEEVTENTQVAFTSKRIHNMKSKRKQVLVKKAHELARIANLKVVMIVYDDSHKTM